MDILAVSERIEGALSRHRLYLEPRRIQQLAEYLTLLERWNRRMNLTSLGDQEAAVERLVVEPVIAASNIDADARRLIDVGSGGGSPAVPLKIVRPDLLLTMVEVKSRKAVFLREVVRHLGLGEAAVENGRAEDVLGREANLGTVDVVSMRAVRADASLLALFSSALRPGGQLLCFLGSTQTVPPVLPPLRLQREVPLVESLRSRLLLVRRND